MIKIAVTSGKGGVGKTSFALNYGAALASLDNRVVVLDGDLGLANIDILAGISPECTLQQVVSGQIHMRDAIVQTPYGVGIISGGSAVASLMRAGPKRLAMFYGQLDELAADTDFLIIDTSAGLDVRVMGFLAYCDHVVVIASPEPTSITDAYALIKVFTRRNPDARIHLVVNQVQSPDEAMAVFLAIRQVCQVFIDQDIEYLGCVRTSAAVGRAIRSRTPFLVSHPKDNASNDVMEIGIKTNLFFRRPKQKPKDSLSTTAAAA